MGYAVKLMKDDKYVILELTDEVTKNDFNNSREDANLKLTTNGWNRLMVDATRGNSGVSLTQDFFFVSELSSRLPEGIRIALVLRPDQLVSSQFVENVAQNRGLNLKLFAKKVMQSTGCLTDDR
jgi:hypothetical protein